jgi:hypothetical protein
MTLLAITHDQVLHAIDEALDAGIDRDPLLRAVVGVLGVHIAQPAPNNRPDPDCPTCEGTGRWVHDPDDPDDPDGPSGHCHCRCPWCVGCSEPVCEGPCETVAVIAERLGLDTP